MVQRRQKQDWNNIPNIDCEEITVEQVVYVLINARSTSFWLLLAATHDGNFNSSDSLQCTEVTAKTSQLFWIQQNLMHNLIVIFVLEFLLIQKFSWTSKYVVHLKLSGLNWRRPSKLDLWGSKRRRIIAENVNLRVSFVHHSATRTISWICQVSQPLECSSVRVKLICPFSYCYKHKSWFHFHNTMMPVWNR